MTQIEIKEIKNMIKVAYREMFGAVVVDERLSEGGNITGLMLELTDGSHITMDV